MIAHLLLACAWEAPIVPPIDPITGDPKAPTNVITGEVVITATGDGGLVVPPSTVVVFVTDARNPMPPRGTGRPKFVGTVPASQFTTDVSGAISAPFSISGVADGTWLVTAFMDADDDFNPLSLTPNVSGAMSGVTCGDVGGAYYDLAGSALGEVTIDEEDTGEPEIGVVVDGITVALDTVVPIERPAFRMTTPGFVVDRAAGAEDPTSQMYELVSTGVHSEIYDVVGPEMLGADPCATFIPLYGMDADQDGTIDPHPTQAYADAGLRDVWPKVYISYLGTAQDPETGAFVNDLEPGEVWAGENVPNPRYALFGQAVAGTVVPRTDIEYMWMPGARHLTADDPFVGETITDVTQIPTGFWSVTMIAHTGQTWNLPNDLWRFDSTDATFDPSTQNAWLVVQ